MLEEEDYPKVLKYLKKYKSGTRYYNLSKRDKNEVDMLIAKLKEE